MGRYIIKRLLISIPTLLLITFICFSIMNLAPGDTVTYTSDIGFQDEEAQASRREALGLNQPFLVRYGDWLFKVVKGDLGTSYLFKSYARDDTVKPDRIVDIIAKKLPYTLYLNGSALLLSFLLCILFSIILTIQRGRLAAVIISIIMFLGMSIPDFFLLLMIKAGIMQKGMAVNWIIGNQYDSYSTMNLFRHSVIPILVLCFTTMGFNIRYLRAAIKEVIKENYITAARSRGIKEHVIVCKHVLRNSMLPLITAISLSLPSLIGGSIIVETVWGWPGIGQYIVIANYARDYPLLMATFLITALLVVVGGILADIAYAAADPRITYN